MAGDATILLYIATAFWIFGYDNIYAIQDTTDDKKIGVKSSALTLGRHLPHVVAWVYIEMVLILLVIKFTMDLGLCHWRGKMAIHLARQIRAIDLNNPATAGRIFRSNRNTGLILMLGLMIYYILSHYANMIW